MEDLEKLRGKLDKGLSGIKALNLSTEGNALSVLALVAPVVTIEMRRIANSLESILEAIYSNQNK